ncbi:flagellin [Cytobacillus oceanisediminis]|uniref:Flagellin n=1 Tax=Cytobacillus oceanisediminis 2691 TaxID=1196031 RepID=A0A169FZM1_9BACI|nr:flagellin [Cytobacillus oceanisediminis]AND42221.1 flagellin [Cytobacillus oceanisediminis 2691]
MRINHNIAALNTYRQLNSASGAQSKSMEKLSSGLRINNAADDAAGLAISEKMRGQIRGLDMAAKNAQDGISLIQTSEGALNETHSVLQRMRELAVQSANDTNTDTDRGELQKELNELIDEVDRIAGQTQFNTKTLMDGTFKTNGLKFQIGANATQNIELKINDMQSTAIGTLAADGTVATALSTLKSTDLTADAGILNQGKADAAITVINDAIEQVSAERSKLGAYQNRLDHTINNLNTSSENLTAAESRIRDVDMAKEMMNQTKNSILSQAAQAMLAQANQQPQGVLQLLR